MTIPVNGQFSRRNGANFSIVDDGDVAGGFRVVASYDALYQIPTTQLKVGMLAGTPSGVVYQYTNTGPSGWSLYSAGGGGATGPAGATGPVGPAPSGGLSGDLVRNLSGAPAWFSPTTPSILSGSGASGLSYPWTAVQLVQRSINELFGTLSPLDFGAAGDGVTDDGPAFQRMFNVAAATPGWKMKVPGGGLKFRIATGVTGVFSNGNSCFLQGIGGTASQIICDTGASVDTITITANAVSASIDVCDLTLLPPTGNVAGVTKNCKRALVLNSTNEDSSTSLKRVQAFGLWSASDLIYFSRGFSVAEDIYFWGCSPQRDASYTESAYIKFDKSFIASAVRCNALDITAWPGTTYDGTSTFGINFTAREPSAPRYPSPIGNFSVRDCLFDEGQGTFNFHFGERREVNASSYKFAYAEVINNFSNTPASAGASTIRAVYGQNLYVRGITPSWENDISKPFLIANGVDNTIIEQVYPKQSTGPSELLIDDPLYFTTYGSSGVVEIKNCSLTAVKWTPRSTVKIYEDLNGVRTRRRMADTALVSGTSVKGSVFDPNGCSQLLKTDDPAMSIGVTLDAAADVGTGSITCPAPGTIADGQNYYVGDYYNSVIAIFECRAAGSPAPGSYLVDLSGITLASELATRLAAAINAVGLACRVSASPAGAVVSLTKLTGYSSNGVAYNDHISKDAGIGGSVTDWSGGGYSVRVISTLGVDLPAIKLDGATGVALGTPLSQSTITHGYFARVGVSALALAISGEVASGPSGGSQIIAVSTRFRV